MVVFSGSFDSIDRHHRINGTRKALPTPQLVQANGPRQCKLRYLRVHGVVFTRITRKQFDAEALGETIPENYVICKDEREKSAAPQVLQQARHFHSWCHRQLTTYGHALPPQGNGFYEGLVDRAVKIDEGHDFAPEWLKLKINYRNTRQILHTASLVAADLLTADDKDDDGIPLHKPVSCGRDGQAPVIIKLPTLRDEAFAIADHLASAHKEGFAWGDMAVLCVDWKTMDLCADALQQRRLPFNLRKRTGDYNPGADAIQVMTMKVSKGLEFPVVALTGVGHMPAPGEDEKDAARVLYVAATRATQRLVIAVTGKGKFSALLS